MDIAAAHSTDPNCSFGETIPVLISGGGPVGLVLSILLSRQGIRNIVVEKRGGVNTLPRARGLTVRSVEILTQLGLGEAASAIAIPDLWSGSFVYAETLAGRIIGVMRGAMRADAAADVSPSRYVVAAQDRIDPMLFAAAASYPEATIRFDTEVTGYSEDEAGITATVCCSGSRSSAIRADYLVAADGGKSPLRAMAGIGETGRANLRSFINNHIRADLSRYTKGREATLIWTLQPGVEGVFQMLDGDRMWAVQVQYDATAFDLADWTDDYAKAHLRAMIGDPSAEEVEIEILKFYGYTLSMMISDRLRQGRLLLTGDAAHQVPPYGGFGLNTGLQSAHNLAWKLAAVLRGEASADLLDTYDGERREVARRVCDYGRTNAGYVEQLMTAVRDAQSFEQKQALVASSRQYGNWQGLDLGVHYEGHGAFVPDDIAAPEVENAVVDFIPHAKPGHRAPHFWASLQGDRVSSIMLASGQFMLLAGQSGGDWIDAASNVGLAIAAYRVAADGDLVPEIDFCSLYGITASGAVLIRPDGHVAYRAASLADDPSAALSAALDVVLRRTSDRLHVKNCFTESMAVNV